MSRTSTVVFVPLGLEGTINDACAAVGVDRAAKPKTIRHKVVDSAGDVVGFVRIFAGSARIRAMLDAVGPICLVFTEAVRDEEGNITEPEAFTEMAKDAKFVAELPASLDRSVMKVDDAGTKSAFGQTTVCHFDGLVDHRAYRQKFMDHLGLTLQVETV